MLLIESDRNTKKKRSPTPPPTQYRTTKLDERSEFHTRQTPLAVGNDAILQLLSTSRRFGSIGNLSACRKVGKSTRIVTGISKLLSKSHKKGVGRGDDAKTSRLVCDLNVHDEGKENGKSQSALGNIHTAPDIKSSPAKHLIAQPKTRLPRNESGVFNSAEPCDEIHLFPINDAAGDSHFIWGQTQENGDSPKERRKSLLPTTKLPKESTLEEVSGLAELIHEPRNLREFLSVKYLTWYFRKFLLSEFSEENLDFWLECETYRSKPTTTKRKRLATKIYEKYIKPDALREVNLTLQIRNEIEGKLASPDATIFDVAQTHVYEMMSGGCYKRFLTSDIYDDLTKSFPASTSNRKRHSYIYRRLSNKKLKL